MMMKKRFLASALATLLMAAGVHAQQEVKLGVFFGFTGPLESITPNMARGAELAIREVNNARGILNGSRVTAVRADSTCVDAAAATAAATRLVTVERVSAIVGGDCSGVTGAVLQNVARPNGIVMISPSATSPALTTAQDDGLFFRTAPSDARQGEIMTDVIRARGINSVAITFTNNDYGKGLANSFANAFRAAGGRVTIMAAHEDNKADYSAEVGALAAAGGSALVVAGYVDKGGRGIIRSAVDSGAFKTFVLPDGMVGESLIGAIGAPLNGSFGQIPGTDSPGGVRFNELAKAAGFDGTSSYAAQAYDAAALIMLSMEAAKSSRSADFKGKVMEVANAPGEKIFPGELAKGLEILRRGGQIDYVGATAVELVGPGESGGSYREIEIKDGKITTVRFR
jgi:branched-chain amino acid transport system substrate-binding protein